MRAAVLLAVLALAVGASAARAQSDAFDPLPQAAPSPTATPEPVDEPDDDDVGRATLYGIGGALVVVFAGLAVWMTRDARRALPREARAAAQPKLREEREHRHERQAKERTRKRARAARASRKRNR